MTSGLVVKLPVTTPWLLASDHLTGELEMPSHLDISVGDVVTVQDRDGAELGRCMVVTVRVNDGPKMLVTLGAFL